MAIVEVRLRNRAFNLECSEEEKKQVELASNNLVSLFERLDVSSGNAASMEHLLVLAAVLLQNDKMPELMEAKAKERQLDTLAQILPELQRITESII
ncbi:MAG: cell division protein ZapA [Rickettsiaceae bacterium]|nr:cell division protein ZapA [Rickettsiaceae bacterium]